jgi:outer membrane immunogenic protein
MKKLLVAAVGLVASSVAPALAADLPARVYTKAPAIVAPIYNWAGFYVGLNGGGGSARDCWTLNSLVGFALPPIGEGCNKATGGLVGGQVGYRWQSANWVFGVEAQGDWANFKGSNSSLLLAGTPFFGLLTNQTKVDALGLFTGQVGYAWNNVLWYGKGGAAVTDNKYNGIFTPTGFVLDSAHQSRWGGTLGTGVEIGFAPGWSVAFEYDHLFMGSSNVTMSFLGAGGIPGFATRGEKIGQDVDIGTVRVNYTFGGPIVAKY